ncbi:CvpA family protein [Candidatus Saganbacteria bacterium]|nr:CvpA family protein [Candidatus Saganbacteria bacterium]
MFNSIDLAIGAALLLFFLFGLKTGLLRNFLSILWIYFCVYFSTAFSAVVIAAVSYLLSDERKLGQIVLTLALFVILYLLGEFVLALLKNVVSIKLLGPLDGLLGGLSGAIKALLICGFIIETLLLLPLSETAKKTINESRLKGWASYTLHRTYPLALSAAPQIKLFVDRKLAPVVEESKVVTAEAGPAPYGAGAGKVVQTLKRFTP